MNKPGADASLPRAVIKKEHSSWLLWLIPLGAAALCVWFVYRDYVATGPLITIYFQKVEGLEEGNTQIQFRGAHIGQVKTLSLTPDQRFVKVTARLTGNARNLARVGSVFWIVRPELKVGSISGLQTIVTGEYISVEPGDGAPTNVFIGLESAPLEKQPDALLITIRANDLDSMQQLSPVFYRGVQVGEILGYQLASNGQSVMIHARIHKEYAPLVRMNSKFWNAGGFDFHFGLFKGAELSAESTRSILSGGLEFATPPDPGEPATNGTVFELNEKAEDVWKTWTPSIPLQLTNQPSGVPKSIDGQHAPQTLDKTLVTGSQ